MNKDDKIHVLEMTLDLLGPNGEGWVQGSWWGQRISLAEGGTPVYIPISSTGSPEELSKANCWCLAGAVNEAAYRLGLIDERSCDLASDLVKDVSLFDLVTNETDFPGVEDFNDDEDTTFPDVKAIIEQRIAQLQPRL